MREELAKEWLEGVGIEIGGLNYPLRLPEGCTVTYVDRASAEIVAKDHGDVKAIAPVQVIDNAETLSTFGDASLDFVVANHVLEHCEDTLGALYTWLRVLKPGGVIYAAIPEKTHTFDRNRAVTTLSHLIHDHLVGTDNSLREHYVDWFANSALEGVTGKELKDKVEAATASRANIHFHVFDKDSIESLCRYTKAMRKDVAFYRNYDNGAEVIVIIKKLP